MSSRADRFAPLAAVFAAFALWFFSLPPGIEWWDTAEAQTVPYMLGIFHPTGFPAYTLAGWLFSHAFAIGNVAWRMSVFTALWGAIACGLLVRAARTLGVAWPIAVAAALALATTRTLWLHASRAGVETMVLACIALAIVSTLEQRPALAAGSAAVALATHTVAIWYLPGLAILWIFALRAVPHRTRSLITSIAAFAGGCALYAYLPIRSAIVNATHVDPSATLPLAYHPWWNYDNPSTASGFWRLVSGADFSATDALAAAFDPANFGADAVRFWEIAAANYDIVPALAAVAGALMLARTRPIVAAGLTVCLIGPIPFSVGYGMLDDASKYYLPAVWILALLLALAAQYSARMRGGVAIVTAALVAIAAVGLHKNVDLFAQRRQHLGEAFIATTIASVPDGAIVCAPWYYATPLAYAAFIEHRLGTRIPCTNVDNDDGLARLAARRDDVYDIPIEGTDIVKPGVRLVPVAGSDPAVFHVIAAPWRLERRLP
jgi:hypothetical protein